MSELTFPEVTDHYQPSANAIVTIKQAVLATFTRTEADLRSLAEKYRGVAFDCSTPKGYTQAKAARAELREHGRYAVQRVRDKAKDELNDGKKVIEAEAERLIAIVKPAEDNVVAQIEAHEARIAAEKAERERIEAERRAKHQSAIATIRNYIALAKGLPAERIARGVAVAENIDVSAAAFEEFADEAARVKAEVVERLREMHQAAVQAEENARLQAELAKAKAAAEAAEREAAAQREAARTLDAVVVEEKAMAEGFTETPAARGNAWMAEEHAKNVRMRAIMDAMPMASAPLVTVQSGVITKIEMIEPDPKPPRWDDSDTKEFQGMRCLTTTAIAKRLGFSLSVGFITETLAIPPVGNHMGAAYWRADSFRDICRAMSDYCVDLAA